MEGIRRERNRGFVQEPWNGTERQVGQSEIGHVVTDSGEMFSDGVEQQIAAHCGCIRPPRGFCSKCHEPICEACFGRCRVCNAPLGPCCSEDVDEPDGKKIRYCKSCYDATMRKRRVRRIVQFLLSPFVDFDSNEQG